jgi:hypothetical protein
MRIWEVKLKGDKEILARLSEKYQTPELTILCDNGMYFLRSSYFSSLPQGGELLDKANQILHFINISLRLTSSGIDLVETDGFWLMNENGKREQRNFGVLNPTLTPLTLISVYKEIPPYEWFELWTKHPEVKYVFRLFSSGQIDWFSLFKIYETIRHDPKHNNSRDGDRRIKSWTSKKRNRCFLTTANWHRHSDYGKNKGTPNAPPSNEMSLSEGNDFIRQIVCEWLTWKTNP